MLLIKPKPLMAVEASKRKDVPYKEPGAARVGDRGSWSHDRAHR